MRLARDGFLGSTLLALGLGCGSADHDAGHGEPTASLPSSVPIAAVDFDAVYVVNGADATVSVIDASQDAVAATIRLTGATFPHHVYASPDGAALALAIIGEDLSGGHAGHGSQGGGSALMVLDAATGATRAARLLDAPNHNGVFDPSGNELWTAQAGVPGAVLVLDAATLETERTIAVGDNPAEVTFSAGAERVFVANTGSNDVTVIDAAAKSVAATLAVGAGPVGAWPAGARMYVDNEQGRSLSAIDVAALAVVRTVELGFTPGYVALAPSGEVWVSDADAGAVSFWAADGTTELGRVPTGAGAHAIAFSADGTRAYVSNQQADSVSVLEVASKKVVATVAVGGAPNGLLFRRAP
jgi:YVTN family beta-propeller protein